MTLSEGQYLEAAIFVDAHVVQQRVGLLGRWKLWRALRRLRERLIIKGIE